MATKLGQIGYRRFDNPSGQVSRAKGSASGSGNTIWVRGPWGGFQPNLDPSQAAPGAASNCSNLIDINGALTQQDGFARIDSTRLPLGDTTPPSSGAEAEPVVGIFEGRTNATQVVRKYVVTNDDSADAAGLDGHFYELVAGVWTHRTATVPADSITGQAADPGATLIDAAHFAAGDYTVFVGGTGNFLNRFPGSVVTEYEKVGNLGAIGTLGANSIVASDERILLLGTTEGGTYFPTRLRYSSKGANAKFDPTITGAGAADFNDFGAEGLAIRNIGPKIALYFANGVQFIRRTGAVTDPFTKDYAAYGRGILGTHAIVEIGYGLHFGVFTDGMFYLDYNGSWQEAGRTENGYHKWFSEFFNNLSWTNRKRVTIEYEPVNEVIYIGWPVASTGASGPQNVWLYDRKTDTIWPAPDWPQMPNIIKTFTEDTSVGETYADQTATDTYAVTFESYEAFGPKVGSKRIAHGTVDGLVFQHSPLLATRDGSLPGYVYELAQFGGDRTDQLKKLDKVNVSYTRKSAATPITVNITGNNGKQITGSISHTKGSPGTKQVDFISGAVTDQQHSVGISGIAPVAVDGLGIQIYKPDSVVRKEGSTD